MTHLRDFTSTFEAYVDEIEKALPAYLPCGGQSYKEVIDAMKYSLLSGGKRIRAVLLLACYRMFNESYADAVAFAAAVEMVHAYSLIHDDLPCMDDDDMRRGKPSCHIAFGEATALLAGDALLTLAFETIAVNGRREKFGAEKTLDALQILSNAVGVNGMIGGQMMDIANEKKEVGIQDLTSTDEKKTGALISAACEIGCVLGGGGGEIRERVRSYAHNIGLAFQVVDDILDVKGDPDKLGKPVGSDIGNHKTTYASLLGTDGAAKTAEKLTAQALDEIEKTGLNTNFLCSLAKMLADRKH